MSDAMVEVGWADVASSDLSCRVERSIAMGYSFGIALTGIIFF
jgi:hypothetical protein